MIDGSLRRIPLVDSAGSGEDSGLAARQSYPHASSSVHVFVLPSHVQCGFPMSSAKLR